MQHLRTNLLLSSIICLVIGAMFIISKEDLGLSIGAPISFLGMVIFIWGISINEDSRMRAFFEIKTRPGKPGGMPSNDPISVYLTVRAKGPLKSLDELPALFGALAGHAERICEHRLIPSVLVPIRRAILSRPC